MDTHLRLFVTSLLLLASLALPLANVSAATFPATFDPTRMSDGEGWAYTAPDSLGSAYTALGDIDGDGYNDLFASTSQWSESPGSYIIYGAANGPTGAFSPDSPANGEAVYLGSETLHVRAIGDFNGDGLDDWLYQPVFYLNPNAETQPPAKQLDAQIILGQRDRYTTPFAIDSVSSIRLAGTPCIDDEYLPWVHPVGDFNGDGLTDLLVLETIGYDAPSIDAVLVPGRRVTLPGSIDVWSPSAGNRTTIRFPNPDYPEDYLPDPSPWQASSDTAITSVADINGDGRDDILIVGSWNGVPLHGGAYVLFGTDGSLPTWVDNETLDGTNGFSLFGRYGFEPDDAGLALSSMRLVSDTNGDAIADLVIATTSTYPVGEVEVIHGRTDWPARLNADDLSSLSDYTVTVHDFASVGDVGDINGDGLGDWVVSRNYFVNGFSVVYGTATAVDDVDIDELDSRRGFTVLGGDFYYLPWIDMHAGDINGDGIDDLLTDIGSSLYLVLGRLEQDAPSSPGNFYPAYASTLIELRWQATSDPTFREFELTRNGTWLASVEADSRRYEDTTAARNTDYEYAIVTIDTAGTRSAPVRLQVNNNHEHYPLLAGEVYSDTLAELFWTDDGNNPFFGIRDYDIYRDGEQVGSRNALSWLDGNYSPPSHHYFIDTNPEPYRDTYRLRSNELFLPPDAGTRAPANVGNPRAELLSPDTLKISWDAAAWGVPPLHYEVYRGIYADTLVGTTNDTFINDTTGNIAHSLNYGCQIVTVDANGRRSAPRPLYAYLTESLRTLLPQEPVAFVVSDKTESTVSISWSLDRIGTSPVGYEILRNSQVVAQTDTMRFIDTGLTRDTVYRYEIRSLDADGHRSLPNRVLLHVLTTGGPILPTRVDAIAYGPGTVEVIWPRAEVGASAVTAYDVYRDGELLARVDALSLMDEDLSPATTYRYDVYSVSAQGVVSEVMVTTTVTTPER